MTIREAILSRPRQVLLPMILILLTLQMYLLFASFRDGRKRGIRLLHLLHAAVNCVFLYFPMLEIVRTRNDPAALRPPGPFAAAFADLPAAVMAGWGILSAVLTALAFADMIRYHRSHLTPAAIKETMDLLPAGIAVVRADGTVVFRNVTMNRLSRALTGRGLNRPEDLRNAAGAAGNGGESFQVTVPGTSQVWQVVSRPLEADGETLEQITATDITEQAEITRELEAKNAKLRELHMRLDIYNKQADRIIIEQEMLTARMAVHNALGNILLESRHYLQDPASADEGMLLQALKNTNTYLLKEYEEDDTLRDPLTDALEMAETIGVAVSISGIPPAADPARSVFAAAVTECATNTVKHADGNALRAEIRSIGNETAFILTGSGNPPEGEIRETGGLRSLRALAEKHGGTMETESDPCFRLTIRLPEEKN